MSDPEYVMRGVFVNPADGCRCPLALCVPHVQGGADILDAFAERFGVTIQLAEEFANHFDSCTTTTRDMHDRVPVDVAKAVVREIAKKPSMYFLGTDHIARIVLHDLGWE